MTLATPTDARGCVLIVDDEDDIREVLREVVEMAGCVAIEAANGEEALELLATHRPCLIILDLLMPVMGGAELVEAMRKRPELDGLAIVISTSAPGRAPKGLPVLPKPVDVHALFDLMRQSCACAAEAPRRR